MSVLLLSVPVLAVVAPESSGPLDNKVHPREGGIVGLRSESLEQLPAGDSLRQDWERFLGSLGGGWTVHVDRRSGLPALAQGRGVAWSSGPGVDVESLAGRAAGMIAEHPTLLGRWGDQLVLDREASAAIGGDAVQIVFRQEVEGVRVEGARYEFHVSHGNLVSFGAQHFAPVRISPIPAITEDQARSRLGEYLGGYPADAVELGAAELMLIPLDPAGAEGDAWQGARGDGYAHRLIWRIRFTDGDRIANWTGEIDAHDGEIVAFYDDTRYERIKGHLSPISDDGLCAVGGCLEPGYPMPYADFTVDGGAKQIGSQHGLYECSTLGSTIRTTLSGPYVTIQDQCGTLGETTTCDAELDLGVAAGNNCAVAPGASPGNTDAARSAYFSLNNVIRKGRFWNPANGWLNAPVTCRTNVNATCNASWGGTINMYRGGDGCGNTAEIQGVVVHEWGHGYDQNDGGGYDNSSEAYADVVGIFEARESCMGRGFFQDGTKCSGYGDTCLTCTGIRDLDFAARRDNTPATPAGFLATYCPGGGGPCGKETHCESYVPAEAIYDLAVRDLPAMGLDAATSWQIAENLWYKTRGGSSGAIFSCALPSSDSCAASSWYQRMRVADDNDGNLANGTPHAGALYAAFARHAIACGSAGAAENQNSGGCPTLGAPAVTARALTNAVELSWPAVAGAAKYRVYRNEIGCSRGQVPVAETTATTYLDDGLANDFAVYYRVQAIGSASACEGNVSACLQAAAQALAGRVQFDRPTYGCSNAVGLKVTDANHGRATVSVEIRSASESSPETVVLTETAAGSGKYVGSISTTSAAAAADGLMSVVDGDVITVEYVDENDGQGGFDVLRSATATADCVFPVITEIDEINVTGSSATVIWKTNEISSTELIWGAIAPPTSRTTGADRVISHSVGLSGLSECTVYYYELESKDPAGNVATSDNGGQFFRFETLGNFGAGLQPCRSGRITIAGDEYGCGEAVPFRVVDLDLNPNPLTADSVAVLVSSTTEIRPETTVLVETGPNTSVFTGQIPTSGGAVSASDGVLQIRDGDLITGTYFDASDGAGYTAISFDTTAADCVAPKIGQLSIVSITDARATFSWTTEEPADSVVEWGPTPALGQVASVGGLVTDHGVIVNRLTTCTDFHFRVKSTDTHGNVAIADNGGQPFRFRAWNVPGKYVLENFEGAATGWTLQGEWEFGAPQNKGGAQGGAKDPDSAYNGTRILGHDLSGKGVFPGDYESTITESAISPTWNGASWQNTRLIYYRQLNSAAGDDANLLLFANGAGVPLYRSQSNAVQENGYEKVTVDIASAADGVANLQLRFVQIANASGTRSGWNVDDLIIKNGALPDYAACGGCGAAPTFAGATSAVDNNACGGAAPGVTVFWQPASAWGTGDSGTYAVYRGETPGFTPSATNRVASGITALSYQDLDVPTDRTLYYVVRAEDNETCSTGPANGGVMDANLRYAAVSETTTQPIPAEVATVRADLVAKTHVRVAWDAVPAAARYRVYRSQSPEPSTFGFVAETASTMFEFIGEGTNANTYYYKVRPVNACGVEGP